MLQVRARASAVNEGRPPARHRGGGGGSRPYHSHPWLCPPWTPPFGRFHLVLQLGAFSSPCPSNGSTLLSRPPLGAARLRAGLAPRCSEDGRLEAISCLREVCPTQKWGPLVWVCTHQRSWVRTPLLTEPPQGAACHCKYQRQKVPGVPALHE